MFRRTALPCIEIERVNETTTSDKDCYVRLVKHEAEDAGECRWQLAEMDDLKGTRVHPKN